MKKITVIAPLLAVLSACGMVGAGIAAPVSEEREFWSTSVTAQGIDRPLVAGTRITLRLSPDGALRAQAGCNHIGGTARIEDGHLLLDAVSMTEIGCPADLMEQDQWLATFLSSNPTWQLAGDDLVLTSGDVKVTFVDRRVADPDRPLYGTEWVVTTLINGDAASSVPTAREAWLRFAASGEVVGSTGCAPLRATATLTGTTMIVSVDQPPSCAEPDLGHLHETVLSVLRGRVSYDIEGSELRLDGPGGSGLRLAARR